MGTHSKKVTKANIIMIVLCVYLFMCLTKSKVWDKKAIKKLKSIILIHCHIKRNHGQYVF